MHRPTLHTQMTLVHVGLVLFGSIFFFPLQASAQGLSVLSVSPASQAISAPADTSITVTFDRELDPSSVTTQNFWAFGRWSGTVTGTVTVSPDGFSATLNPSSPFSAGENVMVLLSQSLTAIDGTNLSPGGYSFLFWVASQPANLQFTRIDEFTTRTFPGISTRSYGGVGCDLDEDGHLDIAVINEDSADLRVYLNRADGTGLFGSMVNPPAAVNFQASPNEPGDFNRDGHIDLVVGNIATDTISVLLGNGDGSFAPQQQIAVGDAPRGVAVLDVDGDADMDIAVANFNSSNLCVLLNNGAGVFGAPTFFEGGAVGERSLAAADFDGDGLLDLACGARSAGRMLILLSNGNGTFTNVESQPGLAGTWMIALGDLNGDGNVDITSVNSNQNTGSVNFGNGDGTVGPTISYPTDPFALATDVGDMDGDGDLDWVTSSFSGDWFLFLNDGNGNFTFAEEFLAPIAASCAVMMDIDTDGDLDLTLIDELEDVVILERNGPVVTNPEFIRGDTNEDGVINVADVIQSLNHLFIIVTPPPCLDAHDFNDDGSLDISDPITGLAYLFSGAAPPPPPFPGCGVDPSTPDSLDCASSPANCP